MAEKRNFFQRLLRIEPGIALGQWVWDRIVNNWVLLTSLFGGSLMSYLIAISDFFKPYGPFGTGATALIFFLLTWVMLSFATFWRAKAGVKRSEQAAIEKWKEEVDSANPLEKEFTKKRVKVSELAHPVKGTIHNKRFIDCELIGPANVGFYGEIKLYDMNLFLCDVIAVPNDKTENVRNIIVMEDVEMIRTQIAGCTIFVAMEHIWRFQQQGSNIVTLTEDPSADSQSQKDTEEEMQP